MSQTRQSAYPTHRYRIFFVDDEPYFVDTVRDVLEGAGYTVFTAGTKEAAEKILGETHVHLAIFDISLEEGNEPPDDSESHNRDGLELAANVAFPALRMMYTVRDNRRIIIEALRLEKVVDYITKDEDGPKGLLAKVDDTLSSKLRINYDLHIHWENFSFMQLAKQIEPDLCLEGQINRVIELEDLFRMQFYAISDNIYFTQISLEALAMDKRNRQWLKVMAYTNQGSRYEYLLLCGERELLIHEYHNFEEAQRQTTQYRIAPRVETIHYGINAYEVFNSSLRELDSLNQHYHRGDFELVTLALNALPEARFERTFRHKTVVEEGQLYQIATGNTSNLSNGQIDSLYGIVERIADEWQQYVIGTKLDVQQQIMRHDVGQVKTYPNPVAHLENLSRLVVQRKVGKVHGDLGLDTVFARESDGELFIVDYADSRSSSVLHDFVTLERSIHLSEISRAELEKYETLAQVLCALDDEDAYHKLPLTLHNPVHLIQKIRRKALEVSGHTLTDYLQDLYIDFMLYLFSYPQRPHAGYQAVMRYSHCLLFAAQICHDLVGSNLVIPAAANGNQEIWLDETHNRVRILGQFFRLTPHQFGIFQHLYEHLGEECSYTDIIRFGLHENPLEDIEYDKPRIHTAVSRLRNRVERFGFIIEAWKNGYYMLKGQRTPE